MDVFTALGIGAIGIVLGYVLRVLFFLRTGAKRASPHDGGSS